MLAEGETGLQQEVKNDKIAAALREHSSEGSLRLAPQARSKVCSDMAHGQVHRHVCRHVHQHVQGHVRRCVCMDICTGMHRHACEHVQRHVHRRV